MMQGETPPISKVSHIMLNYRYLTTLYVIQRWSCEQVHAILCYHSFPTTLWLVVISNNVVHYRMEIIPPSSLGETLWPFGPGHSQTQAHALIVIVESQGVVCVLSEGVVCKCIILTKPQS